MYFYEKNLDVINQGEFLRNHTDFINENIENETIKLIINSWFSPRNKTFFNKQLLEPIKFRKLNQFELNSFRMDEGEYNEDIKIADKLNMKYEIFHSKNYELNGEKTCSYLVKFLDESTVSFGFIEYFFQIDVAEFYACINKINIIQNYFANNININKNMCDDMRNFVKSGIIDEHFYYANDQKPASCPSCAGRRR